MRAAWARWSERIDAMSLRERALLFFAFAFLLLFVIHVALIAPTLEQQRHVARQLAQKQSDTRALQQQLELVVRTRAQDPDASRREKIESLKRELAQVDARLAEKSRELVPPDRIPALLEEFLRRDRKLQLVDLRSLPAAPLFGEKEMPAALASSRAAMQVYRHGVQVTVKGTYFDLQRYLAALEGLPIRMFWRDIEVSSTDYPVLTMKLTVYTLSLDRALLVV